MKPFLLAISVVLTTVCAASAQNAPSDQRCRRHFDREQSDRCNCTAQSGGKVIAIDGKGFNRWDLPQANMGQYRACMKGKGYRV